MMKRFLARFSLIKLIEFVSSCLITTTLVLTFPGLYYAAGGIKEALWAGVLLASLYFLAMLYLIASLVALFVITKVTSSRTLISMLSAGFMLGYSAFFAHSGLSPFPVSFWVAWFCMGAVTYLATWIAFSNASKKGSGTTHAQPGHHVR